MNFAFLFKKLMVCMINTVCVWSIKNFFSWKMIFSLLVLECTYLDSPHQFWTWTAQCHLKGCRIMVSPGVIHKCCGHTDWWSLVTAPSMCLAQFLWHWCPWSWHSETTSQSQPPWEITIHQVLWLSTFQKLLKKYLVTWYSNWNLSCTD